MPQNASPPPKKAPPLRCPACGNDAYFIEVMEHVENLVNANMQNVHLLIGMPDRYYCRECGEFVSFWEG